jgi:hypothetical protein
MKRDMKSKASNILCGVMLAAVMILPVARADDSIEPYSLNAMINLHSQIQVADKTLEPGQYRVVYEGDHAGSDLCAFVSPIKGQRQIAGYTRNGTIVAEVSCTLKAHENAADEDSAVTSQDRITEVQFKGKSEAVEF